MVRTNKENPQTEMKSKRMQGKHAVGSPVDDDRARVEAAIFFFRCQVSLFCSFHMLHYLIYGFSSAHENTPKSFLVVSFYFRLELPNLICTLMFHFVVK